MASMTRRLGQNLLMNVQGVMAFDLFHLDEWFGHECVFNVGLIGFLIVIFQWKKTKMGHAPYAEVQLFFKHLGH